MSHSVPDTADNPKDCPISDCNGECYMEMAGSDARPQWLRKSNCEHIIRTCVYCGSKFDWLSEGVAYRWPTPGHAAGPGGNKVARFCEACHSQENVLLIVPFWALTRLNADKLPGGVP